MKNIKEYIIEGITVIEKPDKNKSSKIDLIKVGKAIEDAGGKDAVLFYTIKKGYNFESFKINTAGELYQSVYNKDNKWIWKQTKNLHMLFNKISMRDSSTTSYGVVKKDLEDPLDAVKRNIADEEASNKLAEFFETDRLYMGTNNWRHIFNGMLKKCS